jgi:hypothetical protein
MDFELTPSVKEPNGRKSSKGADQSPAPNGETGRAASSVRRAGLDSSQYVTVQSHYKEQIPGTSTFSANLITVPPAAIPPPKKRKGANQYTVAAARAQSPAQNVLMDAMTRKNGMAAYAATEFRESNMLSFDNCGGRLKGKRLIADDGTVLEVNGKL